MVMLFNLREARGILQIFGVDTRTFVEPTETESCTRWWDVQIIF